MTDESNGKDPVTGHFIDGNRFWELRTKHGPDLLMESPDELREACCKYFEWVMDTPIKEQKLGWYEGTATKDTVNKLRAMSIEGLCGYLNISRSSWKHWKKNRPDLLPVIEWANNVIRTQQITGATAGLLNARIISRMLGLADKQKIDHSSEDGTMTPGAFDEDVALARKKAKGLVENEE